MLRKSRSVPLPPFWAFTACSRANFTLRFSPYAVRRLYWCHLSLDFDSLCLSCVACASTVVLLLCVSKSLIPCRFSLCVFVTHAFASVCHSRCVLSVVLLCGSYRIHPSTYVISTRVLPHSRLLSPDPIYKAKSKNFFPAMMKMTSCC
jgi:hypothetical protein